MRLRRVISTPNLLGPLGVLCGLASGTVSAQVVDRPVVNRPVGSQPRVSAAATAGDELTNRVATFRDAAGQAYFAASLQPPADDAVMRLVREAPARLSVVIDTSASQAGPFRAEQLAVLRGLLAGLRPGDEIQLFAADVKTTPLSGPIAAGDESAIREAVDKLSRRLPLGNTDLRGALEVARTSLLEAPSDRTRSVVYLGDAAALELAHNRQNLERLVDALRADRISVHSVAIGPTQNIELMATLANHTGGFLAVIGPEQAEIVSEIGRQMAATATVSPIWVESIELPAGMTTIQGNRLPPLRLDRDTLFFGTADQVLEGTIRVVGRTASGRVTMSGPAAVEADHPDFAFLPGFVSSARESEGLLLPTAGSGFLRHVARVMRQRADQLAIEGEEALQTGSLRGAAAITKMALENDPTNEAALSLRKRIVEGQRLVAQNENDPFGDLFGGPADPADPAAPAAATDDPFADPAAAPVPTPAPADALGDDPFGDPATPAPAAAPMPVPADAAGDDPFADPAPSAPAPAAAPMPVPADAAGDDPFADPAPAAAPPAVRRPAAPAVAPPAARPPAAQPPVPRAGQPPRPMPPREVVGADRFSEPSSGILDAVAARRAENEGRLRAEVRAQLIEARRRLETAPIGVSGGLKVLMGQIENQPDIDPQVRQELLGQVRSAVQAASRREASAIEAEAAAAQVAAAATQTEMLLQEAFRREDRLKTLSNQLNALVTEGRTRYADQEITPAIQEIARMEERARVFNNQALLWTQMLNSATRMRELRLRRQRNYLDAFALVEEANIPFVDDVPVQYPDAETWQRMSRRRLEKFDKLELLGSSDAERRIYDALDTEVSYSFIGEPLESVVKRIGDDMGFTFEIDRTVPEIANVQLDDPVTIERVNVSLRSLIVSLLRTLDGGEDLTYEVTAETLYIMPREIVEPKARIYPVGDLGSPIQPGGGGMMGGMGGGMMGGMGGGMGGGMMGGMGGGMGGMGGGMGGMGGGMMMAVPDEVSIGNKSSAAASSAPESRRAESVKPMPHHRIRLSGVAEPVDFDSWLAYFDGLRLSDSDEVSLHDQRVLSTVQYFNSRVAKAEEAGDRTGARQAFVETRDFLAAAILTGHIQPWMHMAYAVALKATGGDADEVERALLSAADLADSPEDMLMVADRLRREGFEASALRICRNVSEAQPFRREPYVMGLRLAEQLDDVDGLLWACRGILSQAWPKGSEKIETDARLLARATHQMLTQQGRQEEAAKFLQELQQATSHDLVVRVSWTGDADVDIAVEEPSGTVCSSQSVHSPGGGTFLGDGFPGLEAADEGGVLSETYVCPQGYSGIYRVLIRRVWGNVTSGHVTIDVLSDMGRPSQRYIRRQIDLTEQDAMVIVEVKDGSRKTEVAEAQLAHLRDLRNAQANHVLGQFADDPAVMQQFLADMANIQSASAGGGGVIGNRPLFPGFVPGGRGFGLSPAVGYQPVIELIPEGAMLMVSAIISADRRYVRVTPTPFFSQILEINTFNFVSGETGDGGGGIGGGGGGIGGGGGGLGGGGLGGGGLGGGGFGGGF